jgi:hypothetical protein
MATQADKKRRDADLRVGMRVWLSTAHLPLRTGTRKLSERFTGPFPILEQVTREAWRLDLPPTLRIHPVFHSSQLKPAVGQPRQRQPILLADDSEEFEVEKLLDRRVVRGKEQFLVRWRGYGPFDDTWEPRENLSNAPEALKAFERRSPG